ncbi:MAG: hypothetical protein RIC56_00895 [Pseudomonadales bacterium]
MSISSPRRPAAAALTLTLALLGCGAPSDSTPDAGADGSAATAETAAQTTAPAPAEPAPPAAPDGETLLGAPPAGWVETGALETPVLRMAEYGPPDEADDLLERLTFEAQTGQPLPDPIVFVQAVSRDLSVRCKGFEDINIASGLENGYPTSVRLMICPQFKDSPHGQVVMAKAIQGNEQFYVVTRRLQTPPMAGSGQPLTAQEMAQWSTHLRGIAVCDTRSADHPCPGTDTEPDTPSPSTSTLPE